MLLGKKVIVHKFHKLSHIDFVRVLLWMEHTLYLAHLFAFGGRLYPYGVVV